jgi:hypothetical protein
VRSDKCLSAVERKMVVCHPPFVVLPENEMPAKLVHRHRFDFRDRLAPASGQKHYEPIIAAGTQSFFSSFSCFFERIVNSASR